MGVWARIQLMVHVDWCIRGCRASTDPEIIYFHILCQEMNVSEQTISKEWHTTELWTVMVIAKQFEMRLRSNPQDHPKSWHFAADLRFFTWFVFTASISGSYTRRRGKSTIFGPAILAQMVWNPYQAFFKTFSKIKNYPSCTLRKNPKLPILW